MKPFETHQIRQKQNPKQNRPNSTLIDFTSIKNKSPDGLQSIKVTELTNLTRPHSMGKFSNPSTTTSRKKVHYKHFLRPKENCLTQSQLSHTTVLTGGLSPVHDYLFEASLQKLGIKALALPKADKESGIIGREYGNNGYCNPAYFTTGNLIKFLQKLAANGMKHREIIENYAFLTAGCGDSPCRFGMYESQYRQSLANAGFDGFRVLTFEQAGGMKQKSHEKGIPFDIEFFLSIVNAFNIADLLNALVLSIRPYELEKGKTDLVLAESLKYLHNIIKNQKRLEISGIWKEVFTFIGLNSTIRFLQQIFTQLYSNYFIEALNVVMDRFSEIEMDRFKIKPKVKITGEVWACITQGDGNYNIHSFLESEGAEVQSDYIATYVTYLLNKNLRFHKNSKEATSIPWWKFKSRIGSFLNYSKKYLALSLGEKLYKREFNRLRTAIGGTLHNLIDHNEMQVLAHPYYHRMLSGGEGYMEVGKNIHYHKNYLTHMVLSLKPFGCMPSTLSDGVQVKVTEEHKDMIFLPLETSTDGEINAHSRVQMALFDASAKAKFEFETRLKQCGKSLDEIKEFVINNPKFKNPFYLIPHDKKTVGVAANFVLHISNLMKANIT